MDKPDWREWLEKQAERKPMHSGVVPVHGYVYKSMIEGLKLMAEAVEAVNYRDSGWCYRCDSGNGLTDECHACGSEGDEPCKDDCPLRVALEWMRGVGRG